MIKKLFISILFLTCMGLFVNAQAGRLLLLKERGVTIRSFSKGDYINFRFVNGQWVTGYLDIIKADSIVVNQFSLQRVITAFGTYGEDTLKLGRLPLHVNEITAFAKDRGHYNSVLTNGAFLQAGGIGYALLNIINSVIKNDPVLEKKNIPKLIGGGVAVLLGKWMRKANPNFRPIGKRYSVEIF